MSILKLGSVLHGRLFPVLLRRVAATNIPQLTSSFGTSTYLQEKSTKAEAIGPHAKLYKIERYVGAASLSLIPVAYFFHGQAVDYALILAIVLNAHWGGISVIQDYARGIIVGEKFAAIAPNIMYLVSALLLAFLLHFQFNDVGLTRAFEMLFSL